MADETPEKVKKKLPRWARNLLLIITFVGPLTGAAVTLTSAYYDIRSKAKDAKAQTKASYETLAPAVKELQELLTKTQDFVDAQDKEITLLKANRDDNEKRILRLEAYVDILSRKPNLPDAPPEVKPAPPVVVSRVRKFRPPAKPIPVDVAGAQQLQEKP
jgi:hypothetical protein